MHQHKRALNFTLFCLPTLQRCVTSKVLVSVTIGMGDFIHSSNACARLVSFGLISCFILIRFVIQWAGTAPTLGEVFKALVHFLQKQQDHHLAQQPRILLWSCEPLGFGCVESAFLCIHTAHFLEGSYHLFPQFAFLGSYAETATANQRSAIAAT